MGEGRCLVTIFVCVNIVCSDAGCLEYEMSVPRVQLRKGALRSHYYHYLSCQDSRKGPT